MKDQIVKILEATVGQDLHYYYDQHEHKGCIESNKKLAVKLDAAADKIIAEVTK